MAPTRSRLLTHPFYFYHGCGERHLHTPRDGALTAPSGWGTDLFYAPPVIVETGTYTHLSPGEGG
jgi:hypothetical protein